MSIATSAYTAITSGLFFLTMPPAAALAWVSGRFRSGFNQRLGLYPDELVHRVGGSPRIWMHAASVGEVVVADAIVTALRRLLPDSGIVLSTNTEHGLAFAREKLASQAVCVYAPVDFIGSVRQALTSLRPDVMVWIETELWPNWICQAQRLGMKTAVVNGRISDRSVGKYLKIRPLMASVLKDVDAFSMIHRLDAERISRMGAPCGRIRVNGNAKYDQLVKTATPERRQAVSHLYGVRRNQPVIVAGSTRSGEEAILLDAFRRIRSAFPDALLILAPRHLRRVRAIAALVRAAGFGCQLRTRLDPADRPRTASVVILDTYGELPAVYGLASIAFCGGSLVSMGGQNPLEASVWGKPVLYGPSMDDFTDARDLLEAVDGGIAVASGSDLTEKALRLLSDARYRAAVGERARQAVISHSGAAEKHAAVIGRLAGAAGS